MNVLTTNYIVACAGAALSREITDLRYLVRIGKLILKNKEISGPGLGGRLFRYFVLLSF
jgi:hypothetical protein